MLTTTQVHQDDYQPLWMAHKELPETLLITADGAAEYITTSVFQYLKVACYGTDGISRQVCGNIIGREGTCSRPNCSFATEPVPVNVPVGTSIRIRVDTAYDVSPAAALGGDDARVSPSPAKMYSNIFLLGDPYRTLVERYNMTTYGSGDAHPFSNYDSGDMGERFHTPRWRQLREHHLRAAT